MSFGLEILENRGAVLYWGQAAFRYLLTGLNIPPKRKSLWHDNCICIVVKLATVLVMVLALISNGCASSHPSTTSSVILPHVDKKPLNAQQKQEDLQNENALQTNNPLTDSVFIANGLVQIGNYLAGGK